MTKKLVIFGLGEIAQVAAHYFQTDSDYQVVAFTVDQGYVTQEEFCGLPAVAFEELPDRYPPEDFALFIAVGYARLNDLRREKYLAAKGQGYQLASYVSSRATILNDEQFGDNCFILENNTLQPFSTIGDNVFLWSGNHIGHHARIGDHCFLASHVVVSGGVVIEDSCFVGVNVTIRDHIRIGRKCLLGAGSIILKDAEPEGLYVGPASERASIPSTRLKKI